MIEKVLNAEMWTMNWINQGTYSRWNAFWRHRAPGRNKSIVLSRGRLSPKVALSTHESHHGRAASPWNTEVHHTSSLSGSLSLPSLGDHMKDWERTWNMAGASSHV